MNPEVSIIIVTYRNQATISNCLQSILRQVRVSYEVILLDNSSDDLTRGQVMGFLADHREFPLTLLAPGTNLGFARGCNRAAARARGEYLMFLNPDTCLENDVPTRLGEFLKLRKTALAAGPMILAPDGTITRTCRNLPTWWRILLDATEIDRITGSYVLMKFAHDRPRRVEQIIGACFFVGRKTFESFNGFDERFFMYYEEVDLCKRLLDSGGEIWFRPEARVMHLAGESTQTLSAAAEMTAILRRSRTLYFEKHFSLFHQVMVSGINRLEGFLRGTAFLFLYLIRGNDLDREKARGYAKVFTCGKSLR